MIIRFKWFLRSYSWILLCLVALVSLASGGAFAQGEGIEYITQEKTEIIAIHSGKISGLVVGENGDIQEFKGIPYAKPPVGPLRWKDPQPVEAWQGVRECIEFGPICPQPDTLAQWGLSFDKVSEDCLYLNVWAAKNKSEERKPVMVWIHGGSNVAGGGSMLRSEGEALARRGVIVVTINYRLGIFGFFAHPLLSKESQHNVSGNYGLLDIIAALKWVQRNIKAFGGDPERVTIFGASAGAMNICYLMASPLTKGLFHRAIAQSGNAFGGYRGKNRHLREGWYGQEPMEAQGERIAKELGCADAADPLVALRSLSAEKLFEVSKASIGMGAKNLYGPVVDGWAIPDDINDIFSARKQHDVPIIVGSNADEGTIFTMNYPIYDVETYRSRYKMIFGEFADDVLTMYPVKGPNDIQNAASEVLRDYYFASGARAFARSMETMRSKAYLYHFTKKPAGHLGERLGALHNYEIIFVFNNLDKVIMLPPDEKGQILAEAMSTYWVQFAKTGNPNKEGMVEWPAYDSKTDKYIEFGDTIVAGRGLRKEACDLFDKFITDQRKHR